MTNETILFAALVALPLITIAAYFIAKLIINIDERKDQQALDAISAKYAVRKAADEKHHLEFMAKIDAMTKETDAKLFALKNCAKWKLMVQEINAEHAAMIKGRNQFAAMMQG